MSEKLWGQKAVLWWAGPEVTSIINKGCRQPGARWAGQGSVLATSFIQLVLNEVFILVLC